MSAYRKPDPAPERQDPPAPEPAPEPVFCKNCRFVTKPSTSRGDKFDVLVVAFDDHACAARAPTRRHPVTGKTSYVFKKADLCEHKNADLSCPDYRDKHDSTPLRTPGPPSSPVPMPVPWYKRWFGLT